VNIWRFARTIGFGRNTLRRDIDRVEHLVLLLAVVFFLLAVPLALLAGIEVRQSGARTVATQPVAHQTVAVLVKDAPANPNGLPNGQSVVLAPGRWRTPSGATRTGMVPAYSADRAGSRETIWIDNAGNQVAQPETTADVDRGAVLTVIALVMCVLICIGCGLWVIRRRLDRRRMATWDADWRATEPNWTKRRG
jgi:hypothetical protein